MAALAAGDWATADVAEPAQRRECSGLVAAHLQWHLERRLPSLPLVDRGSTGERTDRARQVPGPDATDVTKEAQ
jgi:DNA repair protein RecO (recombination protein O)